MTGAYPYSLVLADNWWAVAIRGLVAILFAIFTFLMPAMTLAALIILFAAYAIVDGLFAIFSVLTRRAGERWGIVLAHGILGLAAGIVTIVWPGLTALILLYIIAVWAILGGVFQISAAIRLRKFIEGEWLLILAGIASVLLGVLLVVFPGAGALTVILWIGVCALVAGVSLLVLAFRLQRWKAAATP